MGGSKYGQQVLLEIHFRANALSTYGHRFADKKHVVRIQLSLEVMFRELPNALALAFGLPGYLFHDIASLLKKLCAKVEFHFGKRNIFRFPEHRPFITDVGGESLPRQRAHAPSPAWSRMRITLEAALS